MPPPAPATPEQAGPDPVTPSGWDRLLRDACRCALQVGLDGEQATPKVPAPASLVPLFRHHRLSAASYATIRDAVDDDGIFRSRVAEQASQAEVGRAGWLWLHRPVGWADDPVFAGATISPPSDRRTRGDDGGARLREQLAAAQTARKEAAAQAAATRQENAELRAARDDLAAQVAELSEQRRLAVRATKEAQAELAQARADLRVRKKALVDLEQELAAARAVETSSHDPAPGAESVPVADTRLDRAGLEASVAAAARAAAELGDALSRAASALAPAASPSAPGPEPDPKRRGGGQRKGVQVKARPLPALGPGVFDGTPEAHRCLVSSAANLVVVDGYNVARVAWSGVSPEEERRRTVRLFEAVQARSGGSVVVVFDGQDGHHAPASSRAIRVQFSASGQTADEVIVGLVAAAPADRPVVVVSSDRAVQREVRKLGASVMGSADLLAVAR